MIDWLISLLEDFKHAGPVAQTGLILGGIGVCGLAIGLLHRWRKSGFERLEKEIAELKRRLESAEVRRNRLDAEKREVEERLAAVSARDPWGLLQRAEAERKEKNEELALRLFRQAVENDAPTLAKAAVELAGFHLSCFGVSEEVEHLAAADRYARIARHLTPDDQWARGLLSEIDAFWGGFAAHSRDFVAAGRHWEDAFGQSPEGLTGDALIRPLAEAVYKNIRGGRYYTAFALARRAASLAERELPVDAPLRLSTEYWLGVSLRFLGAYEEARQKLEAALVRAEQGHVLGPEHSGTLTMAYTLAGCFCDLGEYAAAKARFEAVLATTERVLGPEHPNTLATAHEIAGCLHALGEYAAAKARFEAVFAKREEILGSEHPRTLMTRRAIGRSLDALGSHEDAVQHLKGVAAKCEATLGPNHPITLRTGYALGLAMHHAGRTAEAKATLGEVLAGQERKLGPSHPDTRRTRAALTEMDGDASTAA